MFKQEYDRGARVRRKAAALKAIEEAVWFDNHRPTAHGVERSDAGRGASGGGVKKLFASPRGGQTALPGGS